MMQRWLIAPAMLLAASLAAQDAAPAEPIVLWGDFTTATPKADITAFKAKWPKKRPEVIPGCAAEMGYRTIKGRMVTINFIGQDRDADCFNRMYAQYLQRFGAPETDTTTFGSVIGYGAGGVLDTTSVGIVNIWREGEKKIKLVRSPGDGYNLFFTIREDKYLY
jgi:hypothetical protein